MIIISIAYREGVAWCKILRPSLQEFSPCYEPDLTLGYGSERKSNISSNHFKDERKPLLFLPLCSQCLYGEQKVALQILFDFYILQGPNGLAAVQCHHFVSPIVFNDPGSLIQPPNWGSYALTHCGYPSCISLSIP